MTARRARCLLAAAATIAGVALAGAPAAQAVPSVTYKCTPAPADCHGWYRTNVAIDWTVLPSDATVNSGCADKTYTTDTAGTNDFCSASDSSGATVVVQLKIRRDATRPVVIGGSPARAADANGWYNHDVLLSFKGTDQTSGIAACTSTSYGGPDAKAASVTGSCTDNAGNTSTPLNYGLKYDSTGPDVTSATPDRPPDLNGWYNRPVRFDVTGTDALSGLAECPPLIYGGPDGTAAQVGAACRDRAGNTTVRSFVLPFDASAPRIARLRAAAGDGKVDVSWKRAPDAVSVEVTRAPGRRSATQSIVYSGPGKGFRDRKVVNGRRYTYRVRLADAAGNVAVKAVSTKAGPRLIGPASGARRRAKYPPLLRWTQVRRAAYYNLQVFRNGRKVLSAWPDQTHFRLRRSWNYAGRRAHLAKGIYSWWVWPGYGSRVKRHFGKLIGHRTLRIR